jgi:hypothetical protein
MASRPMWRIHMETIGTLWQMLLPLFPAAKPLNLTILADEQAIFYISHLVVNFTRLGNRILDIQEATAYCRRCNDRRHLKPALFDFFD